VEGPATRVELEDIVIEDVYGRAADTSLESGVSVNHGAFVSITRGLLRQHRDFGIAAFSTGTVVVLTDVEILRTLPRACPDTSCDRGTGAAVGVFDQARVEMTDFVIESAPLCGVYLADGGEADLSRGKVVSCEIGVCLTDDGYDVSRLTNDVEYRDNGSNLDSASPPVPLPPSSGEILSP